LTLSDFIGDARRKALIHSAVKALQGEEWAKSQDRVMQVGHPPPSPKCSGVYMAEILSLDDVEDATVLIAKILKKKGHNVHTFTEEDEAINFAKNTPIDLAILDIKLKKMSGIEVLAILKENNPALRAIILTGYPTIETAREAISLGADEYCVKPIDRDELESKVNSVLEQEQR
jgi:DNA-binding NtrC family response regulator